MNCTPFFTMPHIEEISVATPVTFARYLGTPEGEYFAPAKEADYPTDVAPIAK